MKIGITLGLVNPKVWVDVAREADRLGFESLWIPEHLIFPLEMSGSPHAGAEHPPVPPTTPLYDVFGYLSFLAGQTSQIRLGTNVYLLGLRHPFVAARAIQTLDIVSQGRVEVGIGAGWLRQEWSAAGLDPATRGRRLDEALAVCKRLWTEETVSHKGEFFEFDEVAFEPKPIQKPHPPILVGGESDAALRRAARFGDGFYGLGQNLDNIGELMGRLRRALAAEGRSLEGFEVTTGGGIRERDDIKRWEDAGVTRLVTRPWRRSREAVEGMRRFADLVL
jgi:probable F420-dependent oxidoreductase